MRGQERDPPPPPVCRVGNIAIQIDCDPDTQYSSATCPSSTSFHRHRRSHPNSLEPQHDPLTSPTTSAVRGEASLVVWVLIWFNVSRPHFYVGTAIAVGATGRGRRSEAVTRIRLQCNRSRPRRAWSPSPLWGRRRNRPCPHSAAPPLNDELALLRELDPNREIWSSTRITRPPWTLIPSRFNRGCCVSQESERLPTGIPTRKLPSLVLTWMSYGPDVRDGCRCAYYPVSPCRLCGISLPYLRGFLEDCDHAHW